MQIEATRRAAREIEALPNVAHAKVHSVIVRLRRWPDVKGNKKVVGERNRFWLPTGDWRPEFDFRVQFHVRNDNYIIIEKIWYHDPFDED